MEVPLCSFCLLGYSRNSCSLCFELESVGEEQGPIRGEFTENQQCKALYLNTEQPYLMPGIKPLERWCDTINRKCLPFHLDIWTALCWGYARRNSCELESVGERRAWWLWALPTEWAHCRKRAWQHPPCWSLLYLSLCKLSILAFATLHVYISVSWIGLVPQNRFQCHKRAWQLFAFVVLSNFCMGSIYNTPSV